MNIQQHARTTRIKQLSRYLYLGLTGIYYLLWVMCPLAIIALLFSTEVQFTLMGFSGSYDNLSLPTRLLLTLFSAIVFFLMVKFVYHLRELFRFFAKGDIFNHQAIAQMRKALLVSLLIYGIDLATLLISALLVPLQPPPGPYHISFPSDFLVALMFFGFMFVALWALEIGCDLNDESELTI